MVAKYVILHLVLSALAYNLIDSEPTERTDIDGKNVTDVPPPTSLPSEVPTTLPPNTTTQNPNTTTTVTTTTTKPTTTTFPPNTTTVTTTTSKPTTTTTASTTTVNPNITTTAPNVTTAHTTVVPVTTEAPHHNRRFDGPSFIGGIVLTCGLIAIGFVAWKFYKARTERNYHTL